MKNINIMLTEGTYWLNTLLHSQFNNGLDGETNIRPTLFNKLQKDKNLFHLLTGWMRMLLNHQNRKTPISKLL